jgi:hypothetical protein
MISSPERHVVLIDESPREAGMRASSASQSRLPDPLPPSVEACDEACALAAGLTPAEDAACEACAVVAAPEEESEPQAASATARKMDSRGRTKRTWFSNGDQRHGHRGVRGLPL